MDLSYCDKITLQGIQYLSTCSKLESLFLSGCPRLASPAVIKISQGYPALRQLSLARLSRIDDVAVSRIVIECRHLEELNLNGCLALTSQTLLNIAQFVNHRLKKLFLADCEWIELNSLDNLCQFCPNLVALNISSCHKTNDSILQSLSKNCRNLRDLDVSTSPLITDSGVIELTRGCRFLREVNLQNSHNITDLSIIEGLIYSSNLRSLDIRHCRVTQSGIDAISRKLTVTLLLV